MTAGPEELQPSDEALERVAAVLRGGGAVVVPTDTVYGLAALAALPEATARLFELKDRSDRQPMAVLVADVAQALTLIKPPDDVVSAWMTAFWPGPLTVVLPRRPEPRALSPGGPPATLGGRGAAPHWVQALAALVGPIATTSANRHGEPTPTTASAAAASLVHPPDLVVDGGPASLAASTVVDASDGPWRILRPGPVTEDDLRAAVLGRRADG